MPNSDPTNRDHSFDLSRLITTAEREERRMAQDAYRSPEPVYTVTFGVPDSHSPDYGYNSNGFEWSTTDPAIQRLRQHAARKEVSQNIMAAIERMSSKADDAVAQAEKATQRATEAVEMAKRMQRIMGEAHLALETLQGMVAEEDARQLISVLMTMMGVMISMESPFDRPML